MLTKSSARFFFLGGTTVFSLVFLGLTIDTVRQVPARSNANLMNESVKLGHEIWTDKNCMGCHTLLGEGAYYAPELTKVVQRRGKPWLRIFLKDPQAMFPGKRKMVQYHFEDREIEAVIEFLAWIGEIDTNGFPPKPNLTTTALSTAAHPAPATDAAFVAAPEMFKTVCISCHSVGGQGGKVGPALDGVANRFTSPELDLWLKDPQAVKPGTAMPNLHLSDQVRSELVTFLSTMTEGGHQ